MANVIKSINTNSTDYLVGNNIIKIDLRFADAQDWNVGNSITADLISAVDFANPDSPVAITDYSTLYTELKGGRPVFVHVTGPTSGSDTGYTLVCETTPIISGPNAPCLMTINNAMFSKYGSFSAIYRSFNCFITLNANGTYLIDMKSLGESVDVVASASLKPIIIKTAAISGDPAVNDVITLTVSECYDTAKGTTVGTNRIFTKGAYGRRLIVYVMGAGLTLIPCELLPVYSTDYTTPALFSAFTGIKFRGGGSNNYYGLYINLATNGTLTATVEDRTVYNS